MGTTGPGIEALLAHEAYVRALARRLVLDRELARDVEQETWLAALRGGPREAGSSRAWLARVARGFAFRGLRSRSRRDQHEHAWRPEAAATDPAELCQREHARRALVEAVAALEEPWRSTVIARFFDERTPAEIAQVHRVPRATVYARIERGLELLREELRRKQGSAWAVWLADGLRLESGAASGAATSVAAATTAKLIGGAFAMGGIQKALLGASAAVALAIGWLAWDRREVDPPAGEPLAEAPAPRELPRPAPDAGEQARSVAAAPAEKAVSPPDPTAAVREPEVATPGIEMHLRVVDDATGFGIAGARIERSRDEGPDLATDAHGRCVVRFVPPRTVSISPANANRLPRGFCRVHASGYGLVEFFETAGCQTAEAALVVRMRPSARLEVTLLGLADPDPAAYSVRARVDAGALLCNDPAESLSFDSTSVNFDARAQGGVALLTELPPRAPIRVEVLLRGESVSKLPGPLMLEPAEQRSIEIDLRAGCRVRGRVVDRAGASVAGVEIWLLPKGLHRRVEFAEFEAKEVIVSEESDADGRFELGILPAGRYELGLSPAASAPPPRDSERPGIAALNVPVEIGADATFEEVELCIDVGKYVRGRVVGPDGLPIAGQQFQVTGRSSSFHQASAFANPAFVLGPLIDTSYRIRAEGGRGFASSSEVEVTPGAEGVDLVLMAEARVRVRAVDVAGGPPQACALKMVRLDDPMQLTSTRHSFGEAVFDLRSLQAGHVSIVAITPDGRVGVLPRLELRAGVDLGEVEVLLGPSGRIRVRLADEGKLPAVRVLQAGTLVASELPGEDSTPLVADLRIPPGESVVRLEQRGDPPREQRITVLAGEEREVVFGP